MRDVVNCVWQKYSSLLLCATAFLIPLKLSFAYITGIPLIVLFLLRYYRELPALLKETSPVSYPFLAFVTCMLLSSIFGINLARSFGAAAPMLFFPLMVLVTYEVTRTSAKAVILSLIAGQAVAAVHSVFEGGFFAPRLFLGAVTESGQIALTLLVALGVALYLHGKVATHHIVLHPHSALGMLNVTLFTLVAFRPAFALETSKTVAVALPALTSLLYALFLCARRTGQERLSVLLCSIIIPAIAAALIVNLKRGPWAGILVGGTVLFLLHDRKLIIPLLAIAIAALTLPPVHSRLFQSSRDFFISGGRSVIWDVGSELAVRYPLGIGYRNSPFLQRFAPEIPPELKHFHNNFLNIAVEGGWLSVALFLWWIISTIGLPLTKRRDSIIAVSLAAALISWQIAGLVEFNFGDSEVLLLSYIVIGLMLRFVKDGDAAWDRT